jgi:hypothetical protein
VCGQYAFLFALYMNRGVSLHEFINLFGAKLDRQVEVIFDREYGPTPPSDRGGGQCCICLYKEVSVPSFLSFV